MELFFVWFIELGVDVDIDFDVDIDILLLLPLLLKSSTSGKGGITASSNRNCSSTGEMTVDKGACVLAKQNWMSVKSGKWGISGKSNGDFRELVVYFRCVCGSDDVDNESGKDNDFDLCIENKLEGVDEGTEVVDDDDTDLGVVGVRLVLSNVSWRLVWVVVV